MEFPTNWCVPCWHAGVAGPGALVGWHACNGGSLACFAGVEASGAFRGRWALSGKLGFGDWMGQCLQVYLRSSLSKRRGGVL